LVRLALDKHEFSRARLGSLFVSGSRPQPRPSISSFPLWNVNGFFSVFVL
jgi:hypothetical protein